jgi:hypothetical protein
MEYYKLTSPFYILIHLSVCILTEQYCSTRCWQESKALTLSAQDMCSVKE